MGRGEVRLCRKGSTVCALWHTDSLWMRVLEPSRKVPQASDKRRVTLSDWKRKLEAVKIRKEDMNKLIMNFLVTEVRAGAPRDSCYSRLHSREQAHSVQPASGRVASAAADGLAQPTLCGGTAGLRRGGAHV